MVAFGYLVFAAALVAIDQGINYYILSIMDMGDTRSFMPGIAKLFLTRNDGAAFSIFSGKNFMLLVVNSCLIGTIIIFMIIRNKKMGQFLLPFALSLIVAGGAANLIDRLRYGYVVDYIKLTFKPFENFAIFNFADCLVVIGTGFLLIYAIKDLFKKKYKEVTPVFEPSGDVDLDNLKIELLPETISEDNGND